MSYLSDMRDWQESAERAREAQEHAAAPRRVHAQRSPTREEGGKRAIEYGVRVGYWPCLEAPFVQLVWGIWRYDLWYGKPGTKGWREV